MGRPSKARISRARAARAALETIDVQGLHGLNLERVARKLGVRAPSLYHHFRNKSELLAEVALCILRDVRPRIHKDMSWEEAIIRVAVASRREILLHPHAAPLMLEHFPKHIFLERYDFWASWCPYPDELKMTILEATDKLMFGSAMFAAAARSKKTSQLPEFDHEAYRYIAAAANTGPQDDEELFIGALKVILAGLRHYAENDYAWPKSLDDVVRSASR
ncbi:TetR/AcrR family transcriptional regulator [Henriciella aquimarina]|uniref:TetR/AcrR family transcriptional regulator n=1 Tax=Henriciella aquimarina TaxID=545261 RepID=UPI000A03863F|nr:TetR family transcriptional regulator [Henriciella aquimarina]